MLSYPQKQKKAQPLQDVVGKATNQDTSLGIALFDKDYGPGPFFVLLAVVDENSPDILVSQFHFTPEKTFLTNSEPFMAAQDGRLVRNHHFFPSPGTFKTSAIRSGTRVRGMFCFTFFYQFYKGFIDIIKRPPGKTVFPGSLQRCKIEQPPVDFPFLKNGGVPGGYDRTEGFGLLRVKELQDMNQVTASLAEDLDPPAKKQSIIGSQRFFPLLLFEKSADKKDMNPTGNRVPAK